MSCFSPSIGSANTPREFPLSFAYEMRNALAHGYFKIDLAIVWKTIECDLPPLRTRIHDALSTLQGL